MTGGSMKARGTEGRTTEGRVGGKGSDSGDVLGTRWNGEGNNERGSGRLRHDEREGGGKEGMSMEHE